MIRLAEPAFLWLLLLLPLTWYLGRRLRMLPRGRRWAILVVRSLMLAAVVLALARLELRRESRELSVFFLLDRSDSVPRALQDEQLATVASLGRQAVRQDRTGVIAFGERPSLETSPAPSFEFEGRLLSLVEGTRTDIGAAMRLAMAAFPPDTMKRIVLMTDGNENAGSAVEIARYARNAGVPVDVIPMQYAATNDVRVAKLVVPERTTADAPFEIKVYLESQEQTEGMLRIMRDGEVIAQQSVTVQPGRNPPLVLPERMADGGFHNYTATLDVADDLRPQNNRASAFTWLRGEPRILLIEGEEDTTAVRFLAGALKAENIRVDIGDVSRLPLSLDEIQRYDSLVLSNVSAGQMSGAQMQLIERAVHELGIGLVMVGGPDSFGAGGYIDTPIEKALPVSMDVKQKKMLPNGALVIVLHTAEMADANAWAREICVASLNALSAQDYFGVVYWDWNKGEQWTWNPPIAQVGDKKAMRTRLKGVTPGDMPAFDPTMRLAADELIALKAQTKHIVVISDGDPSPPSQRVANSIRNAGITLSAVALAPHDGGTIQTMEQLAFWGGGNFYYPKTSAELPRIFTKEAVVVRKSLIREEQFVPRHDAYSEMLAGFVDLPPLDGYVITSIKELATQALVTEWDDPLLAHWRYGLGKSVAFTSDAKTRWAPAWVRWGNFAKFWSQAVRWSLRETNSPNYQVNTEISGGVGRVTIDAVDQDGNFQNFLEFQSSVIAPDFESQPLDLRQVAPGRYEASFPAGQVGTYMLSMANNSGEKPEVLTAGVSLSYSPEYETSRSNDELLERIAETSGGQLVQDVKSYRPYARDLLPARRPEPIWPWLLLLGTVLLPFDIFLRRVYFNWADVRKWVAERLSGRRGADEAPDAYAARMETLRAAKERAAVDREAAEEEARARAEFRKRLDAQQGGDVPQGPDVFGERTTGEPLRRRGKETFTAEEKTGGEKPPEGGSMSSLLEAKKRAQKRKK